MFSLKSLCVPAALVLVGFFNGSPANAQNAGCYTLESLEGSFGIIGTYGDSYAIALGTRVHDAKGNVLGTFVFNQPTPGSTTGARTVQSGINKGTLSVNCDGTGVITRVATLPDGTSVPALDDFLITEAIVKDGKLIATAMEDAQRIPSGIVPGGVFLTRKYRRRPSQLPGVCYTQESLQGSYAVSVMYGPNLALGLQPETLDGKGNLSRSGINNQPTTGSTTGERTVGTVTSKGTYTVNCNGSGNITRLVTRPDGTTATAVDDFLVIEAVENDGKLLATTIVDVQAGPALVGPTATMVVRTHRLRPPQTTNGTTPPPATAQTVAVASPKGTTVLSRAIQLDGSQSTSADGKPLKYLWSIPAGSPAAAILGATTPTPTVQFAQGLATYTFQLTVTDSAGNTSTDLATVTYQGN